MVSGIRLGIGHGSGNGIGIGIGIVGRIIKRKKEFSALLVVASS